MTNGDLESEGIPIVEDVYIYYWRSKKIIQSNTVDRRRKS